MPRILLPPGCYDLLPPHARLETDTTYRLLQSYASFGYEETAPPLLEYTESMLAGRGAELSAQVFRVLDPDAQKVMGIRADMTLQVARIASSRLAGEERPLRLCYAGNILRAHGEGLREKRQFTQAGIELIGAESPEADAEVIHVAALSLRALGMDAITVDINVPGLVGLLLQHEALENDALQEVLDAIAHKDVSRIRALGFDAGESLAGLIETAGPAGYALAKLAALRMPEEAHAMLAHLRALLALLAPLEGQGVQFTLDPAESRGFAYHRGVSFSFFAPGAAQEIGRGGHYRIEGEGMSEPATGFTLYVDSLRWLLPMAQKPRRVYVEAGVGSEASASLRAEGYVTVHALPGGGTAREKATRQRCDYVYKDGRLAQCKS